MIKMELEPSQRGSTGGKGFEAFWFLKKPPCIEDGLTSSLGAPHPTPTASASSHLSLPAPCLVSLIPEMWLSRV